MEDSRLADLCRSIYRRHRSALDLLFEYRHDRQEEVRSLLTQLIEEAPDLVLDGSSKSYIRFCPQEWVSAAKLNEGEGWTHSGRILLLQFDNAPTKLTLRLSIGPGPEETRRRLLDAAIEHSDPFIVTWKQLGKKWNTIFQQEVVGTQVLEQADFDLVSEAIREHWTSFLAQSKPSLTDAVCSWRWLWSETE